MLDITDNTLLKKYNTHAPRYTSYPTALAFHDCFSQQDFIHAQTESNCQNLSVYIHIPFCHSLCFYCGCNKIVTRHQHKADIYLDYLEKEITERGKLFKHYKVSQLHLGGGTPSFLSIAQMQRLMSMLRSHFNIVSHAEISIEIDPRKIRLDYVDMLKQQGFNRISIGVQDTNEKTQKAINRIQDTTFIAKLVERAKQLDFNSVNLDLIYGLPWQDETTFAQTLSDILSMQPERISMFSYAHMPSRFAAQRKIIDHWLPSPEHKSKLMLQAIRRLTDNDYQFIGMDHFALVDDELSKAYRAGKLHRNFQGYTTQGNCDLLGLGMSSISSIAHSFSQNEKNLKDYYKSLEQKGHALAKGVKLTDEDKLRSQVIKQLMCNGKIMKPDIEQEFGIDFAKHFAQDIINLQPLIADGLVENNQNNIQVLGRGRLLIRHIARVFDAYIEHELPNKAYSKVI